MPYEYKIKEVIYPNTLESVIESMTSDGYEPHNVFEQTRDLTLSEKVQVLTVIFRKMIRKSRKKKV